ncbi:MAG TPA: type I polyketide synthase, partial [Longimicrobium sp.]|nr:type I polyketide synthase [Longimicrobium sp.]
IGYVEAHGTGTPLGDPIELAALTRAFREDTSRRGYCAIGSVKTNIGHLDTAAGLAGFIKVALALHHGEVPASLNFERPNPAIDFDGSPFFVNTALRPWPRGATRRRAGVSSFGIGGTNAHAVLEEAEVRRSVPAQRPLQLVTLSARTASALDTMTRELAEHLERHPEAELADVAFTRNAGRRAFEHRRVVLAQDRAELLTGLRAPAPGREVEDVTVAKDRRIAFLFPGQASQSARMGEALYRSEPVFRQHVDACAEVLRGELGEDLRQVLYPASGDGAARLADPRFALPALFAVEHALARLWMDWGLVPVALLGHSFGEYAAACVAGVLPFEDAARLAAARGRLMAGLPPGAMLAVGLSEAEVSPLLSGRLSLAAVNAPDRCVVSGPEEEVARLERELSARGAGVVRLSSRHAFHSADVEPLMAGLTEAMRRLRLAPPRIPYVSSLTGGWITPAEATSPEYWARQMRAPVRFSAGVDALLASRCVTFVEVGPDQGLTSLVRPRLRGVEGALVVPSLRRADSSGSDARVLHRSLGEVWL